MQAMDDFRSACIAAVENALGEMGAPADLKIVTEIPDNGADLAVPCFTFSKALRCAPQKIADDIASKIPAGNGITGVSSLNGYINFTADPVPIVSGVLREGVERKADFGRGAPTGIRVNVEHTSTNPTGPVHVGRARNPIIGDTLARCLRMRGHDVTTEYYVNDVGKQVVTLAWGVANTSDEEAKAEMMSSENPDERDKVDHRLVYCYRVATKKIHGNEAEGIPADPELEAQVADMMRRFENGDREVIDYVGKVARTMLEGINATLADMNVTLDRYTWESAVIADGAARRIADRLSASKYAGVSEDGARYVDLKDFGIHGKNTKFTFTRADGTTLYTTRDLAYHEDKFSRSDRVIDVLGEDQKLGSQQLCAALQIMGEERRPETLFYAFVSLPEGRMSTRKGVVVYLDDLLEEARTRAYEEIRKRRDDLPEEKMREIARAVGTGAVRFNIVRVGADKQLVFKWEDALNFDGNSGPYLQYVHARACSIIRKAGEFERDCDGSKLTDEYEVRLAKELSRFPEVLREIDESKRVNLLPAYAHDVAAAFNQFYTQINVLNSGDRRDARLTLVECTRYVLASVLYCLGIEAPEEM